MISMPACARICAKGTSPVLSETEMSARWIFAMCAKIFQKSDGFAIQTVAENIFNNELCILVLFLSRKLEFSLKD
jgi:hypothetical protein